MTGATARCGFTSGAAYAAFEDGWRGRAAVGQAADLTVLDIAGLAPELLARAQVDLTVVAGHIAYQRAR